MAANDVQIQIIGRDMTSSILRQVDASLQNTTRNVALLGGAMTATNRVISNAAGVAAGIASFQGVSSVIQNSIGSAMHFAKLMETSEVGMAGILISMTQIDGRTVQWGEALQISKGVIAKLNDEALRTAATSEELVSTFRAILGPALSAKMTISEIIELTSTAVNAVKSMMPGNADMQRQVVQEIRDLVQGGIQPASSTLATALGLKDSDIKAAKESSEGLFKFLMDRLKGFEQSAPAYARTWQGIQDQIKEGITRTGAAGMDPLFNAIKSEMADIAGLFVTINNETKEVNLNQELIGGIRSAAESAIVFGREMKEVGQTLGTVAAPAAQLLGGGMKLIAENAALVTYSIAGWMILSRVSSIYADITAVTAGATAANTALGGAVLGVRNAYIARQQAAEAEAVVALGVSKQAAFGELQLASQIYACQGQYMALGVTAEKAGAMQVQAAMAAARGNTALAEKIMANNLAYAQSAQVATAATTAQVVGAANAKTAVQSMLGTLWALMGGWLGVAAATGIAAAALLDYFDKKYAVESYNPKTQTRRIEDGQGGYMLQKKVFSSEAGYDELGNPTSGETWQEYSPEEYRRHYNWVNRRAQMENQEPSNLNLDDLTKDLTSKFVGTGGGDKAAAKSAEKIEKINEQLTDELMKLSNDELTYKLWNIDQWVLKQTDAGASSVLVEQVAGKRRAAVYKEEGGAWKTVLDKMVKDTEEKDRKMLAEKDQLVDATKRLTLSETEYSLWALEQQKAKFAETWAGNKEMLQTFADFYQAKMQEINDRAADSANRSKEAWADALTDVAMNMRSFSDIARQIWWEMVNDMIRKAMGLKSVSGGGLLEGLMGGLFGGGGSSGSGQATLAATNPFMSVFGVGNNANGTDYWRGGPTWVGEKEPELLNLPRGTSITPASKIATVAPKFEVKVNNYGNSQVDVGQVKFDSATQKYVLEIVLDGAARNVNGFGRNFKAAVGV